MRPAPASSAPVRCPRLAVVVYCAPHGVRQLCCWNKRATLVALQVLARHENQTLLPRVLERVLGQVLERVLEHATAQTSQAAVRRLLPTTLACRLLLGLCCPCNASADRGTLRSK